MAAPLQVLGIAGSLRGESYNRKLLVAARELAPEGIRIEVFPVGDLPFYNADLDEDDVRPEAARRLKEAVDRADAVLFATPEYNHSVPGVLQNVIDWASRPGGRSPLKGKPVAIMGASTGAVGTARAQQQLKLTLLSTLAYVMPHPGILVASAADRFGEDGHLVHEPTRGFLQSFLEELEAWVGNFKPSASSRSRPSA